MATSRRGGQAMSALFRAQTTASCSKCAQSSRVPSPFFRTAAAPSLQRRTYSAEASAAAPAATPSPSSLSPSSTSPGSPSKSSATTAPPTLVTRPPDYTIRAGLLLSRAPLITRDPTPFETSFYLYQKRLNERLTAPFQRKAFFKKDTTPALDWTLQMVERKGTIARDIGIYEGGKGGRGHGAAVAWDDEARIGDPEVETLTNPDQLRERIMSDADLRVSEDGEKLRESERVRVDRPQPRKTEADAKNDAQRLDRKLDRTLYLVVKNQDGTWGFPTADVGGDESLHETAERALEEAVGTNMNTWTVGRVPIAHFVRPVEPAEKKNITSVKTFFIKGRIMAGQANIEDNTLGVTAFKWLTKEELAAELPKYYYAGVKNAITAQ
ncbi:50s ribosomal subunit l30 [Ophiostoma piceae UAMH 11346]|uniref:Large ribosomal subunit protein mL46 n=1 Tax=Ophiostoma piceae (strain UAMH 11346) TaxID=1262450 RepID=S3CE57_OPHP1|nr:50s ribosomal subunit l30 [Ophiostoma piceae UAMH 11346]